MPPAARLGDMHTCPLVTGVVPHVGGPILPPAMPTVLIGGQPAARVGDLATCAGPPDVIAKGSPTVLIGNMMAARIGDLTAHGGVIVMGFPTVIVGDVGAGCVISPSSGMSAALNKALSSAAAAAIQMAVVAGGAGQAGLGGTASQLAAPQVVALQEAANDGIATVEKCAYGNH